MRTRGFTLVEIVIVLAIVGVVLAVAVPAYKRYIDRARVLEAVTDVNGMSRKIKDWQMAKGALPDSLADLALDSQRDPWGHAYEYFNLLNSKGNGTARKDKKLAPLNSDFDLYSRGLDGNTAASLGNSASRDDIVRARDGAFIGLAEDFDP